MGMLSFLGIGKEVGDAATGIGQVLDNLFTSDEEREEAKRLMAQVQDKPHQDQRDINKALAQKAGKWSWHNALGWIASISIGMYFIPQYALAAVLWIQAAWGADIYSMPPFPASADGLMELVVAMLGLAGKVTIERIAKVRPSWRP
jgi:hypothetical protein